MQSVSSSLSRCASALSPPDVIRTLRESLRDDLLAAAGITHEVAYGAEASRESWTRFLGRTIRPLASSLTPELQPEVASASAGVDPAGGTVRDDGACSRRVHAQRMTIARYRDRLTLQKSEG